MNQKESIGNGELNRLSEILDIKSDDKVFLVTGKKSFAISGAEKIITEHLKKNDYTRFSDFEENPKLEDIKKGIHVFKEKRYDLILAVGGGSVIDIAKMINIFSFQAETPEAIIRDNSKIKNKGKHLAAIPTTSGAGSEATNFAVVYKDKEKFSAAHEYIYPGTVIIDPELTYSLSPAITATSGIDALSQAVESYWNVNATEKSKTYSAQAIILINENLSKAVNTPDNASRFNMSLAANLAGKAINITKTTAPHAVSYSMTSYFGIPHGQAVSITLGEFLEFNCGVNENDIVGKKSIGEVRKTLEQLSGFLGSIDPVGAKLCIKELMRGIGLKTKLSELGIREEKDLKMIIKNVNLERLKNNPRRVS
ncbi:MAG: phosphonoacetaldehyde reductase, partial [Bacteroidota bacterium]|nr:phosphonoacetaldehyde reductase [Bacteroidota bacterium]